MANLITLSLIIFSTYVFASGHHRGEQDIELSSPIMNFLSEIKKNEKIILVDDSDIDAGIMRLKPVIIHVEIDIHEKNESKHYNTPIESPVPDDHKKVE
jgi:hypothetical protein